LRNGPREKGGKSYFTTLQNPRALFPERGGGEKKTYPYNRKGKKKERRSLSFLLLPRSSGSQKKSRESAAPSGWGGKKKKKETLLKYWALHNLFLTAPGGEGKKKNLKKGSTWPFPIEGRRKKKKRPLVFLLPLVTGSGPKGKWDGPSSSEKRGGPITFVYRFRRFSP